MGSLSYEKSLSEKLILAVKAFIKFSDYFKMETLPNCTSSAHIFFLFRETMENDVIKSSGKLNLRAFTINFKI